MESTLVSLAANVRARSVLGEGVKQAVGEVLPSTVRKVVFCMHFLAPFVFHQVNIYW